MQLHMIHIAGLQTISQRTDGLSRGSSSFGIMSGHNMLHFVPLHLDAFAWQDGSLMEWVSSWFTGSDPPLFLSPKDWFTRGHRQSTCVWATPPAGTGATSVQQPCHSHLVMISHSMTAHWCKILRKIWCLVFTIPVDSDVWNLSQFDPLIAGLYLPLSRH